MPKRSDIVFHLNGDKLTPMPSRSMRDGILGKNLEDALQTFFERYPEIIPGKQIDPVTEDPPRFVLLRREMPIGGWSLDHLFVDQKGILTLVETKLFQNPESRREVIGQIIEYATNAEEFWANGGARQKSAEFWSNQKLPKNIDDILQDEFGAEQDIEDFWNTVEDNLNKGKLRLIIATDELRPEVRRMIEYLNKEMQNAEVLGLELIFYGNESDSLVLVPRLVGQTQSAIDRRRSEKNIKWTVDKLKKAFDDLSDNELSRKLRKILDWAVNKQIFMTAVAMSPTFGIQGKSKDRIMTIASSGDLHSFINEKLFPEGVAERDALVGELKEFGFLDQDLDPNQVISGRNLSKKLFELNEDEIDTLLKVYYKYCG
jgi:hypothetical protein